MEYRILIVGSGAREHAIARSISKTQIDHQLFCIASNKNPGIMNICDELILGDIENVDFIVENAIQKKCNLAIIGPESPLSKGVVDKLKENNIPSIGPTKDLAQIETSKSFARDLMKEYNIDGLPIYQSFTTMNGVKECLVNHGENYVLKYDGLAGGKGVKVSGEHIFNHEEALDYCQGIISSNGKFVIEEKFIGEEFSLMSFSDGKTLKHMPVIQDHKRAYEGDEGPNTGGMGTYSDKDHSLPFLNKEDVKKAKETNEKIIRALYKKFGERYIGVLYGGFMVTEDGVKVIEYNARFGDPEAMNVLTLLETDLLTIFKSMVSGNLDSADVKFRNQATVCKYAVPIGYPSDPVKGSSVDASMIADDEVISYGSVNTQNDKIILAGSRALCITELGDTIAEAELVVEKKISKVKGSLFHRTDIGKSELIDKKVERMNKIR